MNALANHIRTTFESQRYRFIRTLGHGASGVGVVFADLSSGGRRFVVKKVRSDEHDQLRREIDTLQAVVKACVAMAYPPGSEGDPEVPPASVPRRLLTIHPSSLAHNDMHMDNLMFGNLHLSDPTSPTAPARETAEHSLVPILKLIDFGESLDVSSPPTALDMRGREYDVEHGIVSAAMVDLTILDGHPNRRYLRELAASEPTAPRGPSNYVYWRRNPGVDMNILAIGMVMARIISGDHNCGWPSCREDITDPSIVNGTDPNLVKLVARCLAVDPANRPRLDHLLALVSGFNSTPELGFDPRGASTWTFPMDESEGAIADIVRDYILNADVPRVTTDDPVDDGPDDGTVDDPMIITS
ncbi:uncharacterized protein JN550_002720 [Neoarthrinium moseri]|uniref:uncharacterized protein n=1 Tax=Neoarthrinium moseri TaxID=1658444 RepID=UPI001FDBF5DB|nr:uncharacterized protein JN550_002720 [Neoarthrinium moseri]KAI1874141.1 hypothetical protein JN550_002720 [Neoarthrinium moseri]